MVWFIQIEISTVRFGAAQERGNLTVRFGAVFGYCKPYSAVRCGFENEKILRCGSVRFSKIVNGTVRFGVFM